MKQFNLEEYLKNPSRKVVTRGGRDARIICTDKKGFLCIVALVSNGNYGEDAFVYYSDGTNQTGVNSSIDLFFASIKHEGWQNLYNRYDGQVVGGKVFSSKKEAMGEIMYDCSRITTIKIEWED